VSVYLGFCKGLWSIPWKTSGIQWRSGPHTPNLLAT